jgi:anti-anti-sigma factor
MDSQAWTITIDDDGETLVVALGGEIDMATASELDHALRQRADGHALLVCDLSQVVFMDHSGVNALLRIHLRDGHRFVIREPSPAAERILRLSGLRDVFQRIQ